MTLAFIMAIATLGLNLLTGYTGQLNLAHGGFMAIGAYTLGILTVDQMPFWLAFCCPAWCAWRWAMCRHGLAAPQGHYFSIFTLCVGYIIYLLIEKWELTHGTVGLIGIPVPASIGPLAFDSVQAQYYLVLVFLALGTFVMHRIVSRCWAAASWPCATATRWPSARHQPDAHQGPVVRAVRGLCRHCRRALCRPGALHRPRHRRTDITFDMVMAMLVGGTGTLLGPLLGALLVPWVTQTLQFLQDYRCSCSVRC
jgi:branched-chain amino acid transport system permease protein